LYRKNARSRRLRPRATRRQRILLDHQVARFFADAEALYLYEDTQEMNTLIVSKAISGFSAFV
jgi:hypothetical protein